MDGQRAEPCSPPEIRHEPPEYSVAFSTHELRSPCDTVDDKAPHQGVGRRSGRDRRPVRETCKHADEDHRSLVEDAISTYQESTPYQFCISLTPSTSDSESMCSPTRKRLCKGISIPQPRYAVPVPIEGQPIGLPEVGSNNNVPAAPESDLRGVAKFKAVLGNTRLKVAKSRPIKRITAADAAVVCKVNSWTDDTKKLLVELVLEFSAAVSLPLQISAEKTTGLLRLTRLRPTRLNEPTQNLAAENSRPLLQPPAPRLHSLESFSLSSTDEDIEQDFTLFSGGRKPDFDEQDSASGIVGLASHPSKRLPYDSEPETWLITDLKDNCDHWERRHKEVRQDLHRTTNRLNKAETELNSLAAVYRKLAQDKNEAAQSELIKLKGSYGTLQQSFHEAQKQQSRHKSTITDLNRVLAEWNNELKMTRKTKQELHQVAKALKEQIMKTNDLEKQLATCQGSLKKTQNELQVATDKTAKTQHELRVTIETAAERLLQLDKFECREARWQAQNKKLEEKLTDTLDRAAMEQGKSEALGGEILYLGEVLNVVLKEGAWWKYLVSTYQLQGVRIDGYLKPSGLTMDGVDNDEFQEIGESTYEDSFTVDDAWDEWYRRLFTRIRQGQISLTGLPHPPIDLQTNNNVWAHHYSELYHRAHKQATQVHNTDLLEGLPEVEMERANKDPQGASAANRKFLESQAEHDRLLDMPLFLPTTRPIVNLSPAEEEATKKSFSHRYCPPELPEESLEFLFPGKIMKMVDGRYVTVGDKIKNDGGATSDSQQAVAYEPQAKCSGQQADATEQQVNATEQQAGPSSLGVQATSRSFEDVVRDMRSMTPPGNDTSAGQDRFCPTTLQQAAVMPQIMITSASPEPYVPPQLRQRKDKQSNDDKELAIQVGTMKLHDTQAQYSAADEGKGKAKDVESSDATESQASTHYNMDGPSDTHDKYSVRHSKSLNVPRSYGLDPQAQPFALSDAASNASDESFMTNPFPFDGVYDGPIAPGHFNPYPQRFGPSFNNQYPPQHGPGKQVPIQIMFDNTANTNQAVQPAQAPVLAYESSTTWKQQRQIADLSGHVLRLKNEAGEFNKDLVAALNREQILQKKHDILAEANKVQKVHLLRYQEASGQLQECIKIRSELEQELGLLRGQLQRAQHQVESMKAGEAQRHGDLLRELENYKMKVGQGEEIMEPMMESLWRFKDAYEKLVNGWGIVVQQGENGMDVLTISKNGMGEIRVLRKD